MSSRDSSRGVSEYPAELENGSEILGVDEDGAVVYWDPIREVTLGGDVSPDGDLSSLKEREDVSPGQTLEDVVQKIEDSVGWSSLSEKARSLLDDDAAN